MAVITMREALTAAGVACPRWAEVVSVDDVVSFGEEAGWPLVLKTSRGGYDGRGVWVVESSAQAAEVLAVPLAAGAQWLAEERIDFVQELSAQVARSSGVFSTRAASILVACSLVSSVVTTVLPGAASTASTSDTFRMPMARSSLMRASRRSPRAPACSRSRVNALTRP